MSSISTQIRTCWSIFIEEVKRWPADLAAPGTRPTGGGNLSTVNENYLQKCCLSKAVPCP